MSKLSVLVLGFLAMASAVAAQTPAPASPRVAFYAEPSVVIAFPGHFDNAVGGALALGATIKGVHSVEAEVISFKTKAWSDDFTFTPVLATYKYSMALTGKFSLTVGASMGATFEKTEYYTPSGPGAWPIGGGGHFYSESQTAFTSGLVGGVSYAFNDRLSLDATARVLRLEETHITTAGNMVLVTMGLTVRF